MAIASAAATVASVGSGGAVTGLTVAVCAASETSTRLPNFPT